MPFKTKKPSFYSSAPYRHYQTFQRNRKSTQRCWISFIATESLFFQFIEWLCAAAKEWQAGVGKKWKWSRGCKTQIKTHRYRRGGDRERWMGCLPPLCQKHRICSRTNSHHLKCFDASFVSIFRQWVGLKLNFFIQILIDYISASLAYKMVVGYCCEQSKQHWLHAAKYLHWSLFWFGHRTK